MTELRKLQLLELNLLQKFQQICDENNLTYYLVGGGLIGALRHGGFIPWDDDLDIDMPREDYDRFVAICKGGLTGGYGLIHRDTDIDSRWRMSYSEFVDLYSYVERPYFYESRKRYLFMDIMPVDGMPDNRMRRWLHMRHILFLRYLLVLTDIDSNARHPHYPFYKKWTLDFFRIFPFFKVFDSRRISFMLEKCMKKYRIGDSKYGANLSGRYRSRGIQPIERWGTPKERIFEGIMVKVPEQAHEFQTHMYGDYMKLPPAEQRENHGLILLNHRNLDFEAKTENGRQYRRVSESHCKPSNCGL